MYSVHPVVIGLPTIATPKQRVKKAKKGEPIAIPIIERAIVYKLKLTTIEAMLRWLVKYTEYSYRSSNYCDSKAKSKKEQNELNYRNRNSWKSDR